jgi:arsenite methyltransferase
MTRPNSCKLFEQISHAPFTATGIRPGGFDLTRRAVEASDLPAGARVLDVGCGTGVTVRHLLRERAIEAVGIDLSTRLVAQGKSVDAALPLLLGDAGALPFADDCFDAVFTECTLSLVRDRERALAECHRVLKPLGRLVVTDVYARHPEAIGTLRRLPLESCLKGALDKDELIRECSDVGFATDLFEDHSEMLRDFAAQIIWTYGSLDRFWIHTGSSPADSDRIRCAVREARPGYFLYVGRKAGSVTGADGIRRET